MGSVIVDGTPAAALPTTAALTALANVVLLRIGAKPITSITDASANAIKVNATWEYVRDEVLQLKNWKFAKSRIVLSASATAPIYEYDYAYPLPADYLRLVNRKPASMRQGVYTASNGYWGSLSSIQGTINGVNDESPVYPPGYPYIIEALPSGVLCLMSNYDNAGEDMAINYIRRVTDVTLYPPGFKNCLIYRWAMELAISVTESLQKMQAMKTLFEEALKSSEVINESQDYVTDEVGNSSWENAGR
jgi:hypothetical protein